MGVIPERRLLWMTERQRQELRRAVRIFVDLSAAVAGDHLARRGRRLRRPCALPVARVVRP
jgi:hypothetical protein